MNNDSIWFYYIAYNLAFAILFARLMIFNNNITNTIQTALDQFNKAGVTVKRETAIAWVVLVLYFTTIPAALIITANDIRSLFKKKRVKKESPKEDYFLLKVAFNIVSLSEHFSIGKNFEGLSYHDPALYPKLKYISAMTGLGPFETLSRGLIEALHTTDTSADIPYWAIDYSEKAEPLFLLYISSKYEVIPQQMVTYFVKAHEMEHVLVSVEPSEGQIHED